MPRVKGQAGRRQGPGGDTRVRLRDAAAQLLATKGYAATTTRAIADVAGGDAALIAYHYGGLNALLLAALDASNDARLTAYRTALADTARRRDVIAALRGLYAQDRESGHTTLVAQLVAGGLMDRDLGREVARRMRPWLELTETALSEYLPPPLRRHAPTRELAYLVVAAFLGLEVLDDLLSDEAEGHAVLDAVAAWRPWSPTSRRARLDALQSDAP